jgi:phosphoketolase
MLSHGRRTPEEVKGQQKERHNKAHDIPLRRREKKKEKRIQPYPRTEMKSIIQNPDQIQGQAEVAEGLT